MLRAVIAVVTSLTLFMFPTASSWAEDAAVEPTESPVLTAAQLPAADDETEAAAELGAKRTEDPAEQPESPAEQPTDVVEEPKDAVTEPTDVVEGSTEPDAQPEKEEPLDQEPARDRPDATRADPDVETTPDVDKAGVKELTDDELEGTSDDLADDEAPEIEPMGITPMSVPSGTYCTVPGIYSMDDTASNTSQVRSQNLGGQGTDADVGQQEWATDGLAISTNGDASFAAIVSGAGVDRSIRIHKLLATASVHTQDYWGNTGLSNLPNVTVGAMKKVGADDYYYFGTFRTSGITTVQLDLFAYNAATKAFIGQVARVTVASDLLALISSSTGDIAFDAQGRLMILWGSPTQLAASRLMRLDTVPSTAWDNTTVLASTELSRPAHAVGLPWAGMAYDSTGNLWLARKTTLVTATTFAKVNPTTGALTGTESKNGFIANDLASCGSTASSLTLQKKLGGSRFTATDQFALTIAEGATERATQTTTGVGANISSPAAGPVTITAGQVYTISERGAGTPAATLTSYTSSYVCTWSDGSTLGDGVLTYTAGGGVGVSAATLPVIPTGKEGQSLSCEITNTPKAAPQLVLQKNLPQGRFAAGDQFMLDIRAADSTTNLATATTTGTASNIQADKAGPITIAAGSQYTIAETGTNGASLANYILAYTCTWSGGGTLSGSAIDYNANTGRAQVTLNVIPTGREGETLTCQFDNTKKDVTASPPQLVLQKNVRGRVLAGDQFTLRVTRWSDNAPLGEATTNGPTTGVQTNKATATVEQGITYAISEGMAGGTSTLISRYSANYSCTWNDGVQLARGVLTLGDDGRLQAPLPAIPAGMDGRTLTCTINNSVAPLTGLACSPDDVYVLDRTTGTNLARRATPAGVVNATTNGAPDRISFGNNNTNGLAINLDGSKAVAILQGTSTSNIGSTSLFVWDYASASTTTVALTRTGGTTTLAANAVIGGTIDPSSGDYYFGGYNSGVFILFRVRFDPSTASGYASTYQYVRSVTVPGASSAGGNGDIAFDAHGNLYLVWSVATDKVLARLDAVNVNTQTGSAVRIGGNLAGSQAYNGIAFSGNGELLMSRSNNGNRIVRVDPSTGAQLGDVIQLGTYANVDMASCGLPPTMRLEKELIGGRNAGGDQFTLDILVQGQTTPVQSATTAGSSTGVQPENAGPVVVRVGQIYTIRETAAGTTNLNNYMSSYSCRWSGDSQPSQEGRFDAVTRAFTLPDVPTGRAGQQLVCTISNEPLRPATVTARKLVQDITGQNPVPAAGWSMTSSATGGPTVGAPATRTTVIGGSVASPWNVAFTTSLQRGTLTVAETRQAGYDFVSGTCVVTPWVGAVRNVTVTGTAQAPNPSASILNVASGDRVQCEFINRQLQGSASWRKVDNGSPAQDVAGTEWGLSGPGVPAGTVVADCVAANAAACAAGAFTDRDHRAGWFRLDNLGHGSYELAESKVPEGYVLDGTPREFVISGGQLDWQFAAPFVNERMLGGVVWEKVDTASPGDHLAGSEWKIVGPAPATTERAVVDCVGTDLPTAGACAVDTDPRAGHFAVEGLAWGGYQLIETKAPPGYVLDATSHPFVVQGTALTPSLGQIGNTMRVGPVLPLSGGFGRDHVYLAGAALLLLALAGFGPKRLRASRTTRRA